MADEKDLPKFVWPRGRRTRWAIVKTGTPVLTYGGEWPDPANANDDPYEPLALREVSLYEEFAVIGKWALDLGESGSGSPTYHRPFATEHNPDGVISIPQTEPGLARGGNAETDPFVQKLLLNFVRDYGPPRALTPDEWQPRRFGDEWTVGIPVGQLLIDAGELYMAMKLASDVEKLGQGDDVDRELLRQSQSALARRIARHMDDTRLILVVDESVEGALPTLRESITCLDLLAAMWWQLHDAVKRAGSWRTCEGCQRLFVRHRERQKYHDAACRNRTNVRRHTAKKSNSPT